MMPSVTGFYLGRVSFNLAFSLQKTLVKLVKECRSSSCHTILLLEHFPVYTIGVRNKDPTNDYSDIGAEYLRSLGAEFIKTDRGGLITYHGPGQLVAYPIINMRCPDLAGKGLLWYVRALQQAGVSLCAQYGVKAYGGGDPSDIGVWLNPLKKIMAIGVHKSDFVTYHGLALNCTEEPLSWFGHIVPCGLVGKQATCLSHACHRTICVRDVSLKLMNCLTNSLFGVAEEKERTIITRYRTDLEGSWTETNPTIETPGQMDPSSPPHTWSDVMVAVRSEFEERMSREH